MAAAAFELVHQRQQYTLSPSLLHFSLTTFDREKCMMSTHLCAHYQQYAMLPKNLHENVRQLFKINENYHSSIRKGKPNLNPYLFNL